MPDQPPKETDMPDKVTIKVQDTPSGRLLARAMEIMREKGCTMGEAMDEARAGK